MKKIFLLSVLLFQLTFVFGQNKDWGSWTPVSCYSRLSTSVLGNGYIPSIKEYSWQIRIKSSYSKKVTFNMTWIVGGERLSIGQVTLSPNESYGHTPRYFKSSSNNIIVEVSEVCFEGQDCYKFGFADCNGNQAKITNNPSSANSTNQTNNSNNNQNTQPSTTTNSSQNQTNKSPQQNQTAQNQSNQVINTLPNNTNTEILNVLESTTNQVTNTLTNSIEKSKGVAANNEIAIKAAKEEFEENNLSDKEIDSLLANPNPDNYATINIYKEIKCCHWYTVINGKNLPVIDRNNKKIEYRVYSGNKLLIQTYPVGGIGTSLPIKSVNIRIRKGKTYHFIIKKVGMADFTIEQVDEEPIDKKGNKVYENTNQKIKSDIE